MDIHCITDFLSFCAVSAAERKAEKNGRPWGAAGTDCQKSTDAVIARVLAPVAISQNCFELLVNLGEFETFHMRFPRRATLSSE